MDVRIPRKEVNPSNTFKGGCVNLWIPFLLMQTLYPFIFSLEKMYTCMYVYIIVNCIELDL